MCKRASLRWLEYDYVAKVGAHRTTPEGQNTGQNNGQFSALLSYPILSYPSLYIYCISQEIRRGSSLWIPPSVRLVLEKATFLPLPLPSLRLLWELSLSFGSALGDPWSVIWEKIALLYVGVDSVFRSTKKT